MLKQNPKAAKGAKPSRGGRKTRKGDPGEDFKRERLAGMNSAPNPKVLDESKEIRKTHILRGYTWASVVLCPPLLLTTSLGGLLVWSGVLEQTDEITRLQAMVEQPASVSRAEAEVAVQDWLNAPGQSLPDPQLLYWESSETLPGPELSEEEAAAAGPEAGAVYETHRFKVFSGGVIFTAAVQTATVDGVTTVVSTPSLATDMPPETTSAELLPWPGAEPVPVTEDITRAAEKWAAAYVSGESDELRAITGDTSSTRSYLSIAGAQVGEVDVTSAAVHPSNDTGAGAPVDVAMVRVTFPLTFDLAADEDEVRKATEVSFDLLVRQAATSAPLITSWGVPGSGPLLEDYSAAVAEVEEDQAQFDSTADLQAPAPSVSPATDDQGSADENPADENPAGEGSTDEQNQESGA